MSIYRCTHWTYRFFAVTLLLAYVQPCPSFELSHPPVFPRNLKKAPIKPEPVDNGINFLEQDIGDIGAVMPGVIPTGWSIEGESTGALLIGYLGCAIGHSPPNHHSSSSSSSSSKENSGCGCFQWLRGNGKRQTLVLNNGGVGSGGDDRPPDKNHDKKLPDDYWPYYKNAIDEIIKSISFILSQHADATANYARDASDEEDSDEEDSDEEDSDEEDRDEEDIGRLFELYLGTIFEFVNQALIFQWVKEKFDSTNAPELLSAIEAHEADGADDEATCPIPAIPAPAIPDDMIAIFTRHMLSHDEARRNYPLLRHFVFYLYQNNYAFRKAGDAFKLVTQHPHQE